MVTREGDLEHWKSVLGDSHVACSMAVWGGSPMTLVAREAFLARAATICDLGPTVPVDTFMFGRGEPRERHRSRINGIPYRPADRPWPVDGLGNAMAFFAQFYFADSRDHIGQLPGDVLLIFIATMEGLLIEGTFPRVLNEYLDSLAFEWYPLGTENLVTRDELPSTELVFPRCYLERCRLVDYLDEPRAMPALAAVVPPGELSKNEFMRDIELRALARAPGFKIGGAPYWYSGPESPPKGRFIAAFGDVSVHCNCPYPYVNVPAAMSPNESLDDENYFSFRDGCCINLFLGEDGSIDWHADFC